MIFYKYKKLGSDHFSGTITSSFYVGSPMAKPLIHDNM